MKENIFRCFGIAKEDVSSILSPLLEKTSGVFLDVSGNSLMVDIKLKADDSNFYIYEFTRLIYENLDQYIYSESEMSLEEVAFQLLKINKLKIATAEDLTAGQIICNLIKTCEFSSDIVVEGIVPVSAFSKTTKLNISKNELEQSLNPNVQIAKNMALSLLNSSIADIVISTTGDFSQNQTTTPVFIAIGTRERVDVYKNLLNGSKREIIETTANLALFYLIKKLRNSNTYLEN